MTQRFKQDFKDEIVQGGTKIWKAVSTTGTILLDKFRMERSNDNTQVGDNFGAKEVNAIHKFLNDLLNGEEVVKNAETAKNAKIMIRDGHGIAPSWDVIERCIVWDVDQTHNLPVANALRINGMVIGKIELTVNYMNASSLYRGYNVGTQWVGASVLVTTNIVQGTPYNTIRDWAAYVNGDGTLEVYGYGNFASGQFVNAHVLLIK